MIPYLQGDTNNINSWHLPRNDAGKKEREMKYSKYLKENKLSTKNLIFIKTLFWKWGEINTFSNKQKPRGLLLAHASYKKKNAEESSSGWKYVTLDINSNQHVNKKNSTCQGNYILTKDSVNVYFHPFLFLLILKAIAYNSVYIIIILLL